MFPAGALADLDPELAAALAAEYAREERFVELIASENYVSPRVLECQGSVLTNKYADGYPGRRSYRGCEAVDAAERLAIDRACALFGAGYANVQPYSGSSANLAACLALVEPGATVLALDPSAGGHRTHGASGHLSGRLFKTVFYGLDAATGEVDYGAVAMLAKRHHVQLIVAGYSAYSRAVDWQRFRAIADAVGARFLADMAHVAGLVAAGLHPNPVPIADLTTSTTHKTLRGPRGGLVLAPRESALTARVDAAVYPGTQGGPLMHVVAAKAAAFAEAATPEFRAYQGQVVTNARELARCLAARGFRIVAGGTDTHMVLVDLGPRGIDAARAEARLEAANIALNALSPALLRIGTPAVTTRGFAGREIALVCGWIAELLERPADAAAVAAVREQVLALCREFPIYAR
jgi:glycine hydroxymethyltransferase